MSTSGISFSGLASGLDTASIISALLAVEQRPIAQFEQKKSLLKSQKNLFGDIEGLLEDLVKKADALRLSSTLVDFAATTDREDYLRASASSGAASGSYEVIVEKLAKAQVNASAGKADADTTGYGSGTLLFTIDGDTRSVEIGSDSTLQGIANAINDANDGEPPLGVRAQVVDNGDPTDPYQLVLTSAETGSEAAFSVTTDLGGASLTALIAEVDGNIQTAAQNSRIFVDGIRIDRQTNQVADVIDGVTLDLIGSDPAETTRITINPDNEATSAKVKEFVDKYNEIVDFLDGQSVVDEEGNASSSLFGDSTLRSIRSSLRSITGSLVDTGNDSYQLLAQIGIDSDRDGRLTFNQSEFEEALADDERAVRSIFSDPTSGIAMRIYSELDTFTDSIDGLIKVRKDGIDRMTKQVDDNIRRAEERLEQYELSLTNRFANLEVLMNRLQGQGSAVSSIGAGR